MPTFEIPKQLLHLPIDERGYPVPFFVGRKDGKYDFKFLDATKQALCIEKNICGICGLKNTKECIYFITGPIGFQNRISTDPGTHKVCAEFALQACPHMYFQRAERKADYEHTNYNASDHHVLLEKPEYIILVRASKYKKIISPYGVTLIKFWPTGKEKYIYVNGLLRKELL